MDCYHESGARVIPGAFFFVPISRQPRVIFFAREQMAIAIEGLLIEAWPRPVPKRLRGGLPRQTATVSPTRKTVHTDPESVHIEPYPDGVLDGGQDENLLY
jgi:hypothetical protein